MPILLYGLDVCSLYKRRTARGQTNGQTNETGFIKLTLSKRRPKN